MKRSQALALLNISIDQDLDDQIEALFFNYKTKIYQQLDQTLLYKKWSKQLLHFLDAAKHLGYFRESNADFCISISNFDKHQPMIDNFNQYQFSKMQLAKGIYESQNPAELIEIMDQLYLLQFNWMFYWNSINLHPYELQLSERFDSQALHSELQFMATKNIKYLADLQVENTPDLIQRYVAWTQLIYQKLVVI